MPIYEYACMACGRRVDVVHGIHVPGPSDCEVCGGAMKKALTAPAIHFKGSGWAKKDARTAASAAAPAAAKSDEAPVAAAAPAADDSGSASPAPATPAPAATAAATPAPATSTSGS